MINKVLTPVKVGLLAILATGTFIFALRTVEKGAFGKGDTYRIYAVLDDALGVAKRSRVVMAGIEVGYIGAIELYGSKARLHLRIRKDVTLYRDARLAKISETLLGDKLIDISRGADVAHPLQDGDEIVNVYEEKNMTEMFRTLDEITRDIRQVTQALGKTIGQMDKEDSFGGLVRQMNEIAANIGGLTSRLNQTFDRTSDKMEQILDDVAGVTSQTRNRYRDILDNVYQVSADMKTLVSSLNNIVGHDGPDFKQGLGSFKSTMEKANRSLDNLAEITRKINEGEGTIGSLINNDQLAKKVEGVVDDAASITHKVAKLQMEVDLRSEFHFEQNVAKNYLALNLIPSSDKFYSVEVIDDPRGAVDVQEKCYSAAPGAEVNCDPSHRTKEVTITDKFKFSLQFGKRYQWLALRFGIIEGSGGVGMNWYFFHDDIEAKFDLFQFGKNEYGLRADPRFKAMLLYHPNWLANHIYVAGGGDDFFNKETFDYFFGAGLAFTDDDLKAIFTTVGVPKP